MFCPKCSAQNEEGAVFCSECGQQQEAQPEAEPVPVAAVEATVEPVQECAACQTPEQEQAAFDVPEQEQAAFVPACDIPQQTASEPVVEQTPKKKKKTWLWIIIAVLAGLIVIGGVFVALDYFQVMDLGIFGKAYPIAHELISYDGEENETEYMLVELNDKGMPGVITHEKNGEKTVLKPKYEGEKIVSATLEGMINGQEGTATVEIDEYGNVTTVSGEADGEEFLSEYEYKYDKDGNKLKETFYIDDEKIYMHTYKYDEYGNVYYEKYTDYDSDESTVTIYEHVYEDGKIVETVCEEDDREIYTAKFEYNANGDVVWSEYEYPSRFETSEYTYNEDGNLVKKVVFYNEDEEYRFENEYDEDGNLTKSEVYHQDELESYTEYYWYANAKRMSDAVYNFLKSYRIVE